MRPLDAQVNTLTIGNSPQDKLISRRQLALSEFDYALFSRVSPLCIKGRTMLQQILLLTFPIISTKAMVISGLEFSTKLCATRTVSINIFGSIVKAEKCSNPEFGAATHSLSGTPHWCVQDYMEVTHNDNTFMIPSGCSLWVKEVEDLPMEDIDVIDKTGMKKLSEVRSRHEHIPHGHLVTKECLPRGQGLNSGRHGLRATDYWCRQETISLPFAGDNSFPSGCSCYVR